jgi:murein DD-endopeptidase MepM/ murein hydrolase activator NlpD|tara:strand:- start:7427 stop:9340 length:1914 start_codon:yes stop_codon:yes gene_type:complete
MKQAHFLRLGFVDEPPISIDRLKARFDTLGDMNTKAVISIAIAGFSCFLLMNAAVFVAFDGRDSFSTPSEALRPAAKVPSQSSIEGKTNRVRPSVSTDRDLITFQRAVQEQRGTQTQLRNQTFIWFSSALAASTTIVSSDVPEINVLLSRKAAPVQEEHNIASELYGEPVQSEVALSMVPLDFSAPPSLGLTDRDAAAFASSGSAMPVLTSFSDISSYAPSNGVLAVPPNDPGRIVSSEPENITVVPKSAQPAGWSERLLKLDEDRPLSTLLVENGFAANDIAMITRWAKTVYGLDTLPALSRLRILYYSGAQQSVVAIPMRVSIYRHEAATNRDTHTFTSARTDDGRFVLASEPPEIAMPEESVEQVVTAQLPSLYQSIWELGRRNGLDDPIVESVILALEDQTDLTERITPGSAIEILAALDDDGKNQLLYLALSDGPSRSELFQFVDQDGTMAYLDRNGQSWGPMFLRRPLEGGGRLTSPMGMRTHPITGELLGHEGVDLAAPAGTPIYASADGQVTMAQWNGGYGRHVQLTHENGYVTSYSHMSRIADDIEPGVVVRQGDVIGYVGTTGQSTGNHLHFELSVNGRLLNALEAQLPTNRSLTSAEMGAFTLIVENIDNLVATGSTNGVGSVSEG